MTAGPPPPVATNVLINELDSDTPGTDAAEFIELYDGGAGGTALDGLVVVFYNGSNDLSYAAFDLDGFHTNASGYFTLGDTAVPGVDFVIDSNILQNGADAVAHSGRQRHGLPCRHRRHHRQSPGRRRLRHGRRGRSRVAGAAEYRPAAGQ